MAKSKTKHLRWSHLLLVKFIASSLKKIAKHRKLAGDKSPWWWFLFSWPKEMHGKITDFIAGTYKFSPMQTYFLPEETITIWNYVDKLFIRTLLRTITPVFKHIISPTCLHLSGPSGVQKTIDLATKAFGSQRYRYFIRADIASYYASIDRSILLGQVQQHFNDPRILDYLEQVITIPVIENGAVLNPKLGIARRSSLSPFFGALYLSPLDEEFAHAPGVAYFRYMDDILILAQTKKQFSRAKKRLQNTLARLKLKLAKSKTKMGELTSGLHFLGINCEIKVVVPFLVVAEPPKGFATQIQGPKFQEVRITLHERTCARALGNAVAMWEDSVSPEKVQRYIARWGSWWARSAPPIKESDCLERLATRARDKNPALVWLVTGLLSAWPAHSVASA